MKYFSLLIVAGVVLFSACKSGNNSPKTAKELLEQAAPNMNSGADKFTIETPPGWKKSDTTFNGIKALMFYAPELKDGFRPSLNVVTENMGSNSFAEYVDKNLKTMQQYMLDFKLLDKGDKAINGIHAKWMKYSAKAQGGKELVAIVYAVPQKGIVYNITGVTVPGVGDEYLGVFERAASTFSVTE
ncbi:DUF1795 domain-containing protein [Chitinophaga sp. S165]|uniref:DUF1795 domain-containing protein n=1 Tax=Chitinophaga sp. S165 TaxID=2135462 RepID=UPI000D9C6ABA|nr:DUF1795 domain-containing protein [Chitinophaga sp. S165]PWV46931.1 hypothetical protein C7475_10918 [Chitinophaga sp. S165]